MQLVRRALSVTTELSQARDGLTFQQLCDRLQVPGASMHRLLAVLKEEQFITRAEGSRRYFVGPAAWELGKRAERSAHSVAGKVAGTLVELATEVREPVLFAELVGDRAVCTARIDQRRQAKLSAQIGASLPLHASAAARTLLVDLDEYRVRRLFGGAEFTRFTPRTPRGVNDVLRHLYLTRKHGYGVSFNEFDKGVWALSAPIRGGTGQVLGSVTVASGEERVGRPAARERVRCQVLEYAAAIGAELGHSGKPAAPVPDDGGLAGRPAPHGTARASGLGSGRQRNTGPS